MAAIRSGSARAARRACVSMILACGLAGCTIAELRRDVDRTQSRIDEKQQVLQAGETRRDALEQERQRFVADLDGKRMSLDEMNRRLEQLQAQNRRASATTAQQQAQQRRLDEQIDKHRTEIAQLQKRDDVSDEDKRRRIEQLRQEIRKQLELQLH